MTLYDHALPVGTRVRFMSMDGPMYGVIKGYPSLGLQKSRRYREWLFPGQQLYMVWPEDGGGWVQLPHGGILDKDGGKC